MRQPGAQVEEGSRKDMQLEDMKERVASRVPGLKLRDVEVTTPKVPHTPQVQ